MSKSIFTFTGRYFQFSLDSSVLDREMLFIDHLFLNLIIKYDIKTVTNIFEYNSLNKLSICIIVICLSICLDVYTFILLIAHR